MAQNRRPRQPVSRTPASAPRRVAGRTPRPTEDAPTEKRAAKKAPDERGPAKDAPAKRAPEKKTRIEPSGPGLLARGGTTKVLAGLLGLLLVVGLAELAYLFVFTGEDEAEASADEPVKIQMSEWRTASEKSAKSVTEVLNVSWKNYDQNLEDARKLMTDEFADEYAATTKDSRKRFIQTKADYDFAVVGRSVVRASRDEVTSLLFLNQFVYKGEGKQRTGPEIYQVRVEVTAERSGDRWLISDLKAL